MNGKDKRELLCQRFDAATTWLVEVSLAVACHESRLLTSSVAKDKEGRRFSR